MGARRTPLGDAPPAYRYVTRIYGRSLRPVVLAMSLITAIWALAWTVSSFKQLKLVDNDNLPKLAPLAIAQGTLYAVTLAIQLFGVAAAGMQRFTLVKLYAFLCALSALIVIGVSVMRVVTHFVFKSDLIEECTTVAVNGTVASVFGIWGFLNPDSKMNETEATQFCNTAWNHDSWAEIVAFIILSLLGVLFTSIAFAYYRQALDPTSPANASRLPSNQARRDGYPTQYNPAYDDGTAYLPVYLPPSGPPPSDGKPPEYKHSAAYGSYGGDKDGKEDDPFSEYDGPSVPMPTHWVEDRDVTSVKMV